MAEQFAYLVEGNFLLEQVGGQRVAEQMRSFARRVDASVYQRPPNDAGDGDGVCKTTRWSSMAKENSATGTAWAAEAQIACDGFADVGWQRHLGHASTFAMDGDPTVVPIDIIQFQRNNLAGSQTQTGEQQENGVVPLSPWGFPLAMIEKLLNCAGR
jgi:hypothetical protein